MAPRGYLVFDLETIPDPDLYVHPEVAAGQERPFPPLHAHRPVVFGVLLLDENYRFVRLGIIGEDKPERQMLLDFAAFAEQHRPHLVTYNGRCFDLPVISLRCLRHGVPLKFFFQDRDYRYRFSDMGHIDLYDFLSEHGAARVGSLDAVAKVMGLPGKVGIDGSQVEGLFNAGQLDLIKTYCLTDVVQTTFLFLRYRLVQGTFEPKQYQEIAAELFQALEKDGRTAPVLDRVDRQRLLLLD